MKRRMLFLCAILFLVIVGIAYASAFKGRVTAITVDKSSPVDKSSITVKSRKEMKEYVFECEKGMIPSEVVIGSGVTVQYEEEGNKKKATRIIPDVGC